MTDGQTKNGGPEAAASSRFNNVKPLYLVRLSLAPEFARRLSEGTLDAVDLTVGVRHAFPEFGCVQPDGRPTGRTIHAVVGPKEGDGPLGGRSACGTGDADFGVVKEAHVHPLKRQRDARERAHGFRDSDVL